MTGAVQVTQYLGSFTDIGGMSLLNTVYPARYCKMNCAMQCCPQMLAYFSVWSIS